MLSPNTVSIAGKQIALFEKRQDSIALAIKIAENRDKSENEDAFMVMNLDRILDRFSLWNKEFPEITPFFAVKCNNDPVFLSVLASLGAGFDCASREEIDIITGMAVAPERIVYAHTVKLTGSITHAKEKRVMKMTFDSAEELEKTARIFPEAECILRISVSDPTASLQLNLKFGAEPETDAPRLLETAKNLGLKIAGISFHIGSGSNDTAAFRTAIGYAKKLTDIEEDSGNGFMYYINDGHYQSFAPFLFHVRPVGFPLINKDGPRFPSVIWGPTCDCSDRVEQKKQLRRMEIGEWIVYEHMGAYSMSPASTFNGFQPPKPVYVVSKDAWESIVNKK